jgi:hypothetical protein
VYYHDTHFQRQRHRDRVADMSRSYDSSRSDSKHRMHVHVDVVRSVWHRIRRRAIRRAHAYRAW